jgi:hypothetical protein
MRNNRDQTLAAAAILLTPLVLWQVLFPETLGRLADLLFA